jgi:drug/metabolite transporter (DMT)-like permease
MALYDISLANAYRRGDVSLVYPLKRSLPVLLVPCICFLIRYGKPLSLLTVVGMIIIAIGCFVLPLKPAGASSTKSFTRAALLCIVLASIGTTGYTIIDSMGLALLKDGATHYAPVTAALLYVSFEYLFGMMFLIPYVACSRREKHQLRMIWKYSRHYPLMTGIIITSSYILVLLAMQFATNVSYVVAFRQSSILLGVLLGIFILKEQATRFKIIGVVLIFAGLVLAGIG